MIDDAFERNPGRAAADDHEDSPDARELPPGEAEPSISPDVEALRQDLARCQDRLLRSAAEFDNYRKRTERERREQADRTVSNVLLDLVGVLDDLERAMSAEAGGGSVEAYRAGVELIHRKIVELLKRRDVRPIEAVGAPFDPNLHQAVTTEAAEGHADGEVLEELRRGYMIGERLLRPAMVKVART
jgi:molecular chaperone GrpE